MALLERELVELEEVEALGQSKLEVLWKEEALSPEEAWVLVN